MMARAPGRLILAGLSTQTRCLSYSKSLAMPYSPSERPPMTDKEKSHFPQVEQTFTEEGYPVLDLKPTTVDPMQLNPRKKRSGRRFVVHAKPRETHMREDQDWPSAWPVAKSFVPSAIPMPVRQGNQSTNRPPLSKYANLELLKLPNFLHLSPKAIETHCKAIKKFCTDWPEGVTEEEFPITYVTRDIIHASPTIRDPKSRIVEATIKLEHLKLDERSKDKLIRLARHRYNPATDSVTIVADACPCKVQNKDYAEYLWTALYYESVKHEKWEEEKEEEDWERFYWEKSQSLQKLDDYARVRSEDVINDYRNSIEKVYECENKTNLEAYRSSVESLLGLKPKTPDGKTSAKETTSQV